MCILKGKKQTLGRLRFAMGVVDCLSQEEEATMVHERCSNTLCPPHPTHEGLKLSSGKVSSAVSGPGHSSPVSKEHRFFHSFASAESAVMRAIVN